VGCVWRPCVRISGHMGRYVDCPLLRAKARAVLTTSLCGPRALQYDRVLRLIILRAAGGFSCYRQLRFRKSLGASCVRQPIRDGAAYRTGHNTDLRTLTERKGSVCTVGARAALSVALKFCKHTRTFLYYEVWSTIRVCVSPVLHSSFFKDIQSSIPDCGLLQYMLCSRCRACRWGTQPLSPASVNGRACCTVGLSTPPLTYRFRIHQYTAFGCNEPQDRQRVAFTSMTSFEILRLTSFVTPGGGKHMMRDTKLSSHRVHT
jgi:hypothetical protein